MGTKERRQSRHMSAEALGGPKAKATDARAPTARAPRAEGRSLYSGRSRKQRSNRKLSQPPRAKNRPQASPIAPWCFAVGNGGPTKLRQVLTRSTAKARYNRG